MRVMRRAKDLKRGDVISFDNSPDYLFETVDVKKLSDKIVLTLLEKNSPVSIELKRSDYVWYLAVRIY
jgi:hypothetical protein